MNEAKFKTAFKKSVKAHKGHSLSLAAPMLVGLPDLWVAIPEYIPVLLEAKWLGEITKDKFSRKVPFTPMQQHWIQQCCLVTRCSAMGLVGFKWRGLYYAVLVEYGGYGFSQMTQDFILQCSYVSVSSLSQPFNVSTLFRNVPIPRIALAQDFDALIMTTNIDKDKLVRYGDVSIKRL
jgi:hypothetical protein